MEIILDDILEGMPGITPIEGADLQENCVVMLHRSNHKSPTNLVLSGITDERVNVVWKDDFNLQKDRTHYDRQVNTERSAVCISVLLAKKLTDYTVIMRSRKGTGFDYLLGTEEDFFNPKARLEISGIEKESFSNTTQYRFKQKIEQVSPSDNTGLPAYISVVEFGTPKAILKRKIIIMSDLLKLHNEAMDLALLGDKELELGNKENACDYYFQAFEKEKEVAFMAEEMGNPEPGLSILFRSSASLALQCGKLREAERLIAHALAGNPTNEIAVELRNMLQIIYSSTEFDNLRGSSLRVGMTGANES